MSADLSPLVSLGHPQPSVLMQAHGYAIRGARKQQLTDLNWVNVLTHQGKDVARISQQAQVLDVTFKEAAQELAFLNVIKPLSSSVEASVMELLMITIAESDPALLISRDGNGRWLALQTQDGQDGEPSQDLLLTLSMEGAVQVYARGQGWRDLTLQPDVRSRLTPYPLIEACQAAMECMGVGAGEEVEWFGYQQSALFELGDLALHLMDGGEEDQAPVEIKNCMTMVVCLLAALGTTLPATRHGRLGKRAQQALEDAAALYGCLPTVTALTEEDEDTCEHAEHLRALSMLQGLMCPPLWKTSAQRRDAQYLLLRTLASLLRTLQNGTMINMNAELRRMLDPAQPRGFAAR